MIAALPRAKHDGKPTWKAKLLMPATKRVSLPEQACPETALGATALLCPEVLMLGWTYALSALHDASASQQDERSRVRHAWLGVCMGTHCAVRQGTTVSIL